MENVFLCYKECVNYGKKGLVVDHNHDTGEVRKLLCFECNTGLGFLQENVELLKRAIEYLASLA